MARKYADCRLTPSVSGCTLAMSGEEDELVRALTAHVVDVHQHEDSDELRASIRESLLDAGVEGARPGSFVQLIKFSTQHADDMRELSEHWLAEIGDARTSSWGIRCVDREHPNQYVQIVQFPSYQAAMENSTHPATAQFAERMRKLCDGEVTFTNLDVLEARSL